MKRFIRAFNYAWRHKDTNCLEDMIRNLSALEFKYDEQFTEVICIYVTDFATYEVLAITQEQANKIKGVLI